jgi:hypothetical protein
LGFTKSRKWWRGPQGCSSKDITFSSFAPGDAVAVQGDPRNPELGTIVYITGSYPYFLFSACLETSYCSG